MQNRKHIGPWQRPAPPKRPPELSAPKAIQKPPVPLHEIETQARAVLEGMIEKVRKPGRPSVYERPMTPAERQARRRALQAQERGIQEALNIKDAHGKSAAEADSGGYGSTEIETMIALTDHGVGSVPAQATRPGGAGPDGDGGAQKIHVCGLSIGDEESNRCRFAEQELEKIVAECFTSPAADKMPSASWVARHVGNVPVQRRDRPSLALTCKICGETMGSTSDAMDHLRVDHRKAIDIWFRNLKPEREFRDMGSFVTVAIPRNRKSTVKSRG